MSYQSQYYTIRFLYVLSVAFTKTTFVPFLLEKGLSTSEVHFLYAIFSISVMFLEIPTSALGECSGPRRSFIVGCLFKVLSATLFLSGSKFTHFATAEIFSALATACITGSLSAWVMNRMTRDSRTMQNEIQVSKVFIVGDRYSKIALALGGASGAYIGSVNLGYPWIGVAFGFALTFLLTKILLAKDQKFQKISQLKISNSFEKMKYATQKVWENPILFLLVFEGFAIGTALASPKMYSIPYLRENFGKDMFFIGNMWLLLATLQFLGTFGLSQMLSISKTALRLKFIFCLFTLVLISGLLVSRQSVVLYICIYFAIEWIKPYHRSLSLTLFHENTQRSGRLTILSLDSLVSKLGTTLGLLFVGWATAHMSIEWAWSFPAILYFIVILSFLRLFVMLKKNRYRRQSHA